MRVDLKKHFWWCWFWQVIHKREPNDYDGVCYNCGFDRYNLQSYKKSILRRVK